MRKRATKSFPVRCFPLPRLSIEDGKRKGESTTRLEKQRERQTKDLRLGTLCPLELIRKRDFEIVMILCLRRFSAGEKKPRESERKRERGKCWTRKRESATVRRGRKEGGNEGKTRRQPGRLQDEEGAESSDVTGG